MNKQSGHENPAAHHGMQRPYKNNYTTFKQVLVVVLKQLGCDIYPRVVHNTTNKTSV